MHKATVHTGYYFLSGFSIQKGLPLLTVEIKISAEVLICCFTGKRWKVSLKLASCAKSYRSSGIPRASGGESTRRDHARKPEPYPNAHPAAQRGIWSTHPRSRCPPLLGCRNIFLPPLFLRRWGAATSSGRLTEREEELKKQNPLALQTAEYLCPLQKGDFTACSSITSFFPPFF